MALDPLAVAIAAGIEAARALDEERVREIVRQELAAFKPEVSSGWATIPKAAKAEGRSTKHVRELVKAGYVVTRQRGISGNRVEINMNSLRAALAGEAPQAPEPIDATSWAARRAARKAAP
jgi:hypothetical protein